MNDEEEPEEYVVWCKQKYDESRTTFGPFPSKYIAEHFILNYGFKENIFDLTVSPLNRIQIKIKEEHGEEEEGPTPQTTH